MDCKDVHVYSIGHSNHALERFIELLREHEIGILADVRRFPGSRKHPHFGNDALATALAQAEVEYLWMEALGGRRSTAKGIQSPNLGLRNASFRNYADYMITAEFDNALEGLCELASRRPTAMMCAEATPLP